MNKKYIYEGNIEITKDNQQEWQEKLKNIRLIKGYLSISSNATLQADNLKSIGGDLYIYSNVTLPNLKSVGGDLSIHSNATLQADNLKSVGGYLYIHSNVTLPNLKSIGGDLYIYSNVTLPNLKSVGGYLSIHSNVTLPNLKSVGGYLYINSKLADKFEKRLWKNNRNNEWYLTDRCSEFLLSCKGKITYKINNVEFVKELFDKVRKDQLTAQEVFAIQNMEQRRVAYEKMDKIKMRELPNLKVLEERKEDGCGYPDKVISFTLEGFNEDFRFYNCFDPSTGREYFLETRQVTCAKAKAKSFGFDEIVFDKEY